MTGCGRWKGFARGRARERIEGAPIEVRASPLDRRRGLLRLGPLVMPCALGRSGITSRKREGDGATPLAAMPVLHAYLRRDRQAMPPASPLAPAAIGPRDGWCDDPRSSAYNAPVRLPHRAGAERMWREDRLYDAVVVLDWNVRSRARRRGSAIFLHVAKPGYPPTEGCIAVAPRDMARLLPHLRRGRVVRVIG